MRKTLCVFLFVALNARATVHYTYTAANPANPVRTESRTSCTPGSSEYTTYAGIPEPVDIARMVIDRSGNTLVGGSRSQGAFIARLDSTGCPLFTITIEASASARALAVDTAGRIVLAGFVQRSDLPVVNALRDRQGSGFLARFSADGSQLLSSTYIDGEVNALTLDSDSNLYLTGQTGSPDFPDMLHVSKVSPRNMGPSAVYAAYFMKLTPAADRILASGYLAGDAVQCGSGSTCFLSTRNTSGVAIALDAERNVIFAGNSYVTDLPTTEGALRRKGIGAFIAKLRADGTRLMYSTYLGARNDIVGLYANPATLLSDMTVDGNGNAIVVGRTYDESFPATQGALQPAYSGPILSPGAGTNAQTDAFATKLNATGSAIIWGTYFGASTSDENFESVSLDTAGNLWLGGTTNDFRKLTAPSTLAVSIDSNGSRIQYSGVFAPGWGRFAILDGSSFLHVAGPSGLVSVFRPTR
jgi:hypothetical protein